MFAGLPVGAFLAALLVLVPLPWHWQARNVATLSIIAWLFVVNIIYGINAIIWGSDAIIRFAPWCDIVTKIQIGSNVALPAACFCLDWNLASVASINRVRITTQDRRRRRIFELVICWGVPAVYMTLHYIVQGHRFDIVQGFGCRPTTYVSWPGVLIIWVIPLLFTLAACRFAGLALYYFILQRAMFSKHLQSTNSGLTPSRYLRLLALSLAEMFWGLLVTILNMRFSLQAGLRPWISWENVHSDFSRINQYPLLAIPSTALSWTLFLWWTVPVSAMLFFLFFAFGEDAMREYRAAVGWVRRTVLRQSVQSENKYPFSSSSHSTYVHPPSLALVSFTFLLPVSQHAPRARWSSLSATKSPSSRQRSLRLLRAPPRTFKRRKLNYPSRCLPCSLPSRCAARPA
ncbi:STE3-domain-containing protein [Gloeophyllum trabeum ATCC 11539]|uniref:STE3-domain-containing protein n=1 Tax=Gloeophyllum trabeum (strain ATCC 11539 / FP-39264 / Madison 617) TaxID=670483 RepID=S7Q7U2_GLOTA|nr:STE3-domain-containing protein [Gloeophyllum trabeum ATCC 11539]EPQ55602.1 STE3-domain-containing protein [Gloeophyllum trabeum ATCC 11539]